MQLGGYATTDMHVSMIDKCSCKDRKILIRQVVTVFAAPCLAAEHLQELIACMPL